MTIDINLDWKGFNVDLNTIRAWMQANVGTYFAGLSANTRLVAHFTAEPGDSARAAVASYWAALNNSSTEATAYKSMDQRDSDLAAAAVSGKAKLAVLGLSDEEIAALIG